MTNEQWLKYTSAYLDTTLYEHAKKLVEVVEDAKLLAYDNECLEYVHNLQNSIENLERE